MQLYLTLSHLNHEEQKAIFHIELHKSCRTKIYISHCAQKNKDDVKQNIVLNFCIQTPRITRASTYKGAGSIYPMLHGKAQKCCMQRYNCFILQENRLQHCLLVLMDKTKLQFNEVLNLFRKLQKFWYNFDKIWQKIL